MTQREQLRLIELEKFMRDNAMGISGSAIKMAEIDRDEAIKAMEGIIDYLKEKHLELIINR